MKNLLFLATYIFILAIGGVVFTHTSNFIAATTAVYLLSFVLPSFSANSTLLFCTLAHVRKAPCGTPNPGGGRKIWIAPASHLSAGWGVTAVDGIIQTAPTYSNKFLGWIELDVTDHSLKLDQLLKGRSGHQAWENAFEVKVAGDTQHQTIAIDRFVNSEVVAVIQLNDLKRKNIGSTVFPLTFEITHTTGAKGSDERGWTLKAKNDGLSVPSYFLNSSILLPLNPIQGLFFTNEEVTFTVPSLGNPYSRTYIIEANNFVGFQVGDFFRLEHAKVSSFVYPGFFYGQITAITAGGHPASPIFTVTFSISQGDEALTAQAFQITKIPQLPA